MNLPLVSAAALPLVAVLAASFQGAEPEPAGADVHVRYLEIVSADPTATCEALEAAHGVEFGEPVAELGNARTLQLAGGDRIGVRGKLRPDEAPVVRPYLLVADIESAVKKAEAAGAKVAVPPLEIPGQGTFAIYVLAGVEHGLWKD